MFRSAALMQRAGAGGRTRNVYHTPKDSHSDHGMFFIVPCLFNISTLVQ